MCIFLENVEIHSFHKILNGFWLKKTKQKQKTSLRSLCFMPLVFSNTIIKWINILKVPRIGSDMTQFTSSIVINYVHVLQNFLIIG